MWPHIEGTLSVKESTVCPGDFKLIDKDGELVTSIKDELCGQYTEATARRLADCWNACEGIAEPSAVRELIQAVRELAAILPCELPCDAFHHKKSDQHSTSLICPLSKRYENAIDAIGSLLSRLKGK